MFQGHKALEDFKEARIKEMPNEGPGMDDFYLNGKLKSSVNAKVQELHDIQGIAWNTVLDLIRDMLKIESEQRPKAKEVVERLNEAFRGGYVVS